MKNIAKTLLVAGSLGLLLAAHSYAADQRQVAEYIRANVLGGSYGQVTLWMTPTPLDQTYVARDLDPRVSDAAFPYPQTWLVMIDDQPEANFGHPVRWLFVRDDLAQHTAPLLKQFPPTVQEGGTGAEISFQCVGVTPAACPSTFVAVSTNIVAGIDRGCRYAVLISGGINNAKNFSRYPQNLRSMYQKLRQCGFRKISISVYYADGNKPLDLDNLDGDNNDNTGNDVTGAADAALFRPRIQSLCATLDPQSDVLLVYTSNHGGDNLGLCLWDLNSNGQLESSEFYTPAQFSADTTNCHACRLFAILDQCFAGEFTSVATDGLHNNSAIYAAATAFESSYGREYMSFWETMNPATTTMNAMHASVTASMVALGHNTTFAEGTPGIGNVPLCNCCLFVLAGITLSEVVLSFQPEQGTTNTVEYTDKLPADRWQPLQTVVGTGGPMTVRDTRSVSNRFYRVSTRF